MEHNLNTASIVLLPLLLAYLGIKGQQVGKNKIIKSALVEVNCCCRLNVFSDQGPCGQFSFLTQSVR